MFEKDPRLFSPEYKSLSPEQKAMVKLEITLTNFFRDFNNSITRWERIIYPLMVVLFMMVISGFYLIYNVTKDMHTMSNRIDPEMHQHLEVMSQNMTALTKNIAVMTENMNTMTNKMENMDVNIHAVATSVDNIRYNTEVMAYTVSDMNMTMKTMTQNTGSMSRDIHKMKGPMNMFDKFMP